MGNASPSAANGEAVDPRTTALSSPSRVESSAAWLDRAAHRASVVPPWLAAVLLGTMLVGLWVVVYWTGGTRGAMAHLFYLPIILATLPFGLRGSLTVAAAAAVLCGPIMPLDSVTGEAQHISGWLVRGAMFLTVGTIASLAISIRERSYELELSHELLATMSETPQSARDVDRSLLPLVADALENRRFHPVYQPIYSLHDGRLVGVEALSRFDVEPYRTPDAWFAAAAATGIGVELEIAAIEEALRGATALPPGISVSVNASPATLAHPRLLELVALKGDRPVTIELTEHDVIEDYHLLKEWLVPLRLAGARIAVDDAGAGFSSLQHIVQLAPDIIELDMSLAQHVSTSPVRRALAGSLIEFALQSGALLVVEGIEDEPDLAIWTALGAHAVQGYLVGRPGPLPAAPSHHLITSLRGAVR